MPEPAPAPLTTSGRFATLRVLLAIGVVVLAVRLAVFGDPVSGFDEQFYRLVGTRMLAGDLPYVDLWDRKPIGVFLINALGALVAGDALPGVQTIALGCVALGAFQTYRIARAMPASEPAALLPALAYPAIFPAFSVSPCQTEVFYLPLLLGMVQALAAAGQAQSARAANRLLLLAMLLGGLALQIKYMVLPFCAFAGAHALWQVHGRMRRIAPVAAAAAGFIVAGLAPTLAVAAFYLATGHFADFWFANFASIFARGALSAAIQARMAETIAQSGAGIFALALAGLFFAMRGGRLPRGYGLVLGFAISGLVAFAMIGNLYTHYFAPAVPFLLLLAVPALSAGAPWLAAGALLLAFLLVQARIVPALAETRRDKAAFAALAATVRPLIGPGRCLWVFDGPSALYLATGACIPTTRAYPDHLNNVMEDGATGVDAAAEVRRILVSRPAAIVIAERPLPIIPHWNPRTLALVRPALARDYAPAGAIVLRQRRLLVYRLRSPVYDAAPGG